ncbi:MAG TPA: hypothetical protein VF002_03025 [Gaiellaceae bacterium]
MKRVLVLAAATVLVLPAASQAASWQGVVIAKNGKRRAIVTASANGTVRTARTPAALYGKVGLGALVSVRAGLLPDGTYAATGAKRLRRAKQARVNASVVKRAGRILYLSGGQSVFTLVLRRGAGSRLQPGDRISTTAVIGKAQLFCDEANPAGHSDQLDLEGIYLSSDAGVLQLAVHGRGLVKVTIPAGFQLPTLNAGDELSLSVTVQPDGTFTLVTIDDEDAAGSGDGGSGSGDGGSGSGDSGGDGNPVDMGSDWFTVTGLLGTLSPGQVSVNVEHHPDPVSCAVPSTVDLSGFSVGQLVEMSCNFADGNFVLVSLKSQTAEVPNGGDSALDLKGFISALGPSALTVSVPGGSPVTCGLKPGEDLRGFTVGDFVEIGCTYSSTLGHYLLTSLSSSSASLQWGDGGLSQSFDLSGAVSTLAPDYVAVQVAHHDQPVECSLPAGMDLRGFAVGNAVEFSCENDGSGFVVKSISSDSASWPESEMPQFSLDGILRSIRTDGVSVQVPGHPSLVDCGMPAGTNLSGFALGDTVTLHCHYHDGGWHLAELSSEHADLVLEP